MEKKIDDIIFKAEDLWGKIRALRNEKNIPVIELDIILLDIRALYEEIKNLQAQVPSVEIPQVEIPAPEDKATPEAPIAEVPEPEATTEATTVENPEVETQPAESSPAEVPSAEIPKQEIPEQETPKQETPKQETPNQEIPKSDPAEKSGPATTVADKYKGGKKFINESLAGTLDKNDIGHKIHSTPIQNIGSALGINDRFKLINDLFKGDKDSFQNTVKILDSSPNFNEAFNYITSSFDWDMEEDSVQILLDLVRRKFIVTKDE